MTLLTPFTLPEKEDSAPLYKAHYDLTDIILKTEK